MFRFALIALALSACTTEPSNRPDDEETTAPGIELGGNVDELAAPEQRMSGPVVVEIDFGAHRPRTELRLDYAGPPPYLVALLREGLGLEPNLQRVDGGCLALLSLDGTDAEDGQSWLVLQERNHRFERLEDLTNVPVQPGDRLHFLLDVDLDGDGVGERMEQLYGTRDDRADTDGDGLSDWYEIYAGWTLADGRFVKSDPAQADSDGDGINDAEEQDDLSDPRADERDEAERHLGNGNGDGNGNGNGDGNGSGNGNGDGNGNDHNDED